MTKFGRSLDRFQKSQCTETSLGKFGQVWTCLDKFGQVWTSLDKFRQVWTSLDKFGQVWTSFDKFGRVWTSLDKFGRAHHQCPNARLSVLIWHSRVDGEH